MRFQWLLCIGTALACSPSNVTDCLTLWASTVLGFSSDDQYDHPVSSLVDMSGDGWQPASSETHKADFPVEYLWLGFSEPLWVVAVGVNELSGAGATVQIAAQPFNNTAVGGFVQLWSGQDIPDEDCPRFFTPNITCTISTQSVLLVIRTDVTYYTPEISRVALLGNVTKPSFLPICNYSAVCTPSYCKHNGKCISSASGLSCLCKDEYSYGNNCEWLRLYPISLGNFTVMPGEVDDLPNMLGIEDGDDWEFSVEYAPPYVFVELNLPQPLYVYGFRIYGSGSALISDVFVLSPTGYWQQVWTGISQDCVSYVDINVSCAIPFVTSAIRIQHQAGTLSSDGLDAIQVLGKEDVPQTGTPCVNRCVSSSCYQSRCSSGLVSASCACLSPGNISWSGPLCTSALQFATTGALSRAVFWKDSSASVYPPIGYQGMTVGVLTPVYITRYDISMDNRSYSEVFVSSGNNQYISVWHAGAGVPINANQILCQPSFPVTQLTMTYDFPLECEDCPSVTVTAAQLIGTLSVNHSLPACPNSCTSGLCMNNASCFGYSNSSFRCNCTTGFGGRYCNVSANYATALLDQSYAPNMRASSIVGPPDEYDYQYHNVHLWTFPGYSGDTTRELDFLELQFALVNATALQLFESKRTPSFGFLSSILVFVSTPFPHYEEVLAITTPNGGGISRRVYVPPWSCRSLAPTSRVRLVFSWLLDPTRGYNNAVDAARLFSAADGPSVIPAVCTNLCTNASICGVGGYCVSKGTGLSCICLNNFTGTRCEFQTAWVKSAISSSDLHANSAVSLVVGPPDAYPEIDCSDYSKVVYTQWSPLFDQSWLEVVFDTPTPVYVETIEIFQSGLTGYVNFTRILAQINNVTNNSNPNNMIEVWRGSRPFNSTFQRVQFNIANFSCNPGPIQKVRLEFSGLYFSIDSIRLIGNKVNVSSHAPPLCTAALALCSPNPCQNSGACTVRSGNMTCDCVNGYYSNFCELSAQIWVSQVRDYSSSYYDTSIDEYVYTQQGPQHLLGAPTVWTGSPTGFRFEAKDNETTLSRGTVEFVEVVFPAPVYLGERGVKVIETNNSGAIVRLLARTKTGLDAGSSPLVEIWRKPSTFSYNGSFQPLLNCRPSFAVDSVRIEVDVNLLRGWEEYDAVALIGAFTPIVNNSSLSGVPMCDLSATSALCSPTTCLHDGVCVLTNTSQSCICHDMWRGANCERPSYVQTNKYNQKTVFVTDAIEEGRVLCIIFAQGNMSCINNTMTLFTVPPPAVNISWLQVVASTVSVCMLDSEGYVSCYHRFNGTFLNRFNDTYYSIAAQGAHICGITRKSYLQCNACMFDRQFCPIHLQKKYTEFQYSLRISMGLTRAGHLDLFWYEQYYVDIQWSDYSNSLPIERMFLGGYAESALCYLTTGQQLYCRGYLSGGSPLTPKDELQAVASGYELASISDAQEVCAITQSGYVKCRNQLDLNYNLTVAFGIQSSFSDISLMFVGIIGSKNTDYDYDDHTYNIRAHKGFCAVVNSGEVVCDNHFNASMVSDRVQLACDVYNGGCSPYATCKHTPRLPVCTCFSGFIQTVNGVYSDCQDIDECATGSACRTGEVCVNLPGTFSCRSRNATLIAATGCGGKGDNSTGVWLPIGCSTNGTDTISLCGSDIVDSTGQPLVYSLAENGGICQILPPYLQTNQWLNTTVNGQRVSFLCPQLFTFLVPTGSGTQLSLELPGANVTSPLWYSYAPPYVTNKTGCTTNCSREGLPRPVLTLNGVNFGIKPRIFLGGSICPVVDSSQTFVSCEWPEGKGMNLPVAVLAGDQNANSVAVSYMSCPPGFEDEENSTNCLPCKPGFVRALSDASASCSLCDLGKFANGPQTECLDCGSKMGLECVAGKPIPAVDYWGYYTSQDFVVMRCPPGHCLGNGECAPGRDPASTNMLCAYCKPPLAVWGNQCMECDSVNVGLLFGLIILFEVFFLFTHFTSKRDRNGGMPKLMVYFIQIALVLVGVADVHLSFLGVFNFDLARASTWSPSCLFPMSVEAQVAISLFMPIWLLLIVLLNFIGQKLAFFLLCSLPHLKAPLADRFFRTSLTMLVFAYSATCTKVFELLQCVDTPDGGSVLLAFPTIACDESFYQSFRPVVILVLAVYILGFPVGCVALLLRWKRRGVLGSDDARYKALNFRWGVWFMAYRPAAFYWQSVELLRRFGFAILNHLADTSRGLAFSYLNLAALLAHMLMLPYTDPSMNKAEMLIHIVLLCLSLLVTSTDGGSVVASWIYFLLVILTIAGGIFFVIFQNFKAARSFFKLRREAALSRKEQELTGPEIGKLPRSASAMPHEF